MKLEELRKENKKVHDDIKVMKKKFNIRKRSRDSAVVRHIIQESTGTYIPFTYAKTSTKTPAAKIIALMIKKAYILGRMDQLEDRKYNK